MTNSIRISDIQTSQIFYYDPIVKEDCYKFCHDRGIDCLPSLENSEVLFQRDDNAEIFTKKEVDQRRKVDGFTNIFRVELLEQFRANHLLFVYTLGVLSGVIHFSDYNKPEVSAYLYELFFSYEKGLRELLKLKALENSDMSQYFIEKIESSTLKEDKDRFKKKKRDYEKYAAEFVNLPRFQSFFLDDLIGLAKHKSIVEVNSSDIVKLRNHIMHFHELVNMEDIKTPDFIYKFDTFEVFFNAVITLQHDMKLVRNRISFLSGDIV